MIGRLNNSFGFTQNFQINIRHNSKIEISKENDIAQSNIPASNLSSVLGYNVDKDGYFTAEFNKAAGIPTDYKIHSSTMESLSRVVGGASFLMKTMKNVDIAKTAGNAYKILTQVVGEEVLNSKENFTKEDLAKFPQGFSYDKRTLKVDKVYNGVYDYDAAAAEFNYKDQSKDIDTLFFNESMRAGKDPRDKNYTPATSIFSNNNGGREQDKTGVYINVNGEKYLNSDGSVTKGGLLAAVVNKNLNVREGETTIIGKMQGYDKNVDAKAFREKINLWHSQNDMNNISDEQINSMDKDMQDYVRFMKNLLKTTPKIEDDTKLKTPAELLFEQIEKANKELLEALEVKRQELRLLNIKI